MQSDQTTPPKRTITKEEVQKLRDGATPGPWTDLFPGEDSVVITQSDRIPVAYYVKRGDRALIAAAPDLATFALTESARADRAEAMTFEAAAQHVEQRDGSIPYRQEIAAEIRDLAPASGLAMLAELRAELRAERDEAIGERTMARAGREIAIADRDELRAAIFGSPDYAADLRNGNFREMAETLHSAQKGGIARAEKAEAERDTLAAANAALEARVAELVKNLRWIKDRLPLPPIAIEKREGRQARGDYEAQEWLEAMYDTASCARAALASGKPGEAGE